MFEERPIHAFEEAVQILELGSDPPLLAMEGRRVEDLHLAGRRRQRGDLDEFVLHAGLDILVETFECIDEELHIPGPYLRPI
jgi:hypothetical protein